MPKAGRWAELKVLGTAGQIPLAKRRSEPTDQPLACVGSRVDQPAGGLVQFGTVPAILALLCWRPPAWTEPDLASPTQVRLLAGC